MATPTIHSYVFGGFPWGRIMALQVKMYATRFEVIDRIDGGGGGGGTRGFLDQCPGPVMIDRDGWGH